MRLNLLQHLTGETFHKTHNIRLVWISPLKIKRDNFCCDGTFWTIEMAYEWNFEEKKDYE